MKKILLSLIFLNGFVPAPAFAETLQSVYTDLTGPKCRSRVDTTTVGKGYPIESGLCPGVGGYQLSYGQEDERASLSLLGSDKKEYPLRLDDIYSGFHYLGKKAEWRVSKKGGKNTPQALIFRFDAVENPKGDDTPTTKSYLLVAKITPKNVCVVGKIEPGPKANEEARSLADVAAEKACLLPEVKSE